MLMACGGAKKEKEAELPTFCVCIKNGVPPAGCDKVMKDITEEEFSAEREKCK
jgi:hypothetical protein